MPLRTSKRPWKWACLVLTGGLLVGCSMSEKKLSYVGQADLQHYKDVVTSIDYPAVNEETPDVVSYTDEPRRIRNPRKDEVWNISLEEALHTALGNSEIIRDNGQFLSPGNRLLTNPDFVQSVYDPALQETSTLFGQNGPEAALSEFDATLTTSMTWGRSEQISDTTSFNGITRGDTQAQESGDFRSGLSKIFANGAQVTASHNVLYQGFNQGSGSGLGRMYNSDYVNNPSATQNAGLAGVEFDYQHPLWAGSGTRFTRIAGPISRRPTLQNVPQVNQGVVISRIRTDIALADFEQAVIGLVKDVEDVYWDLYLSYRRYDSEIVARNSSLRTWREIKNKVDQGLEGAGTAEEAQARDSYFEIRARTEDALSSLNNSEGRLRRMLGLPVNDGRIMRPSDEPTTAEFLPDWRGSLVEALCRRVELRKQKWNIQSLEFQVEAARSLAHPRLDFVSRYQINGFGDQLFGSAQHKIPNATGTGTVNPTGANAASFYENLLSGNQTGWALGFQFNMPLGFRAAHAQVRNLELKLAKAKAALSVQEHEISHELANSFRQMDAAFQTAQTNFNRRRAAERRLQAYQAQYDAQAGKVNIDLVLRSQISLAQAEVAYYTSLVSYNRAITDLKYRKGTLMQDEQVYLSESLSHPESYPQALRKAWARSHAFDAKHLKTEPPEFVRDSSDPVEMSSPRIVNPASSVPPAPTGQPLPAKSEEYSPSPELSPSPSLPPSVPVPAPTPVPAPVPAPAPEQAPEPQASKTTSKVIQQVEFVPPPAAKPVVKTLGLTEESAKPGFQKPVVVPTTPAVEADGRDDEDDEEKKEAAEFQKPK